jgi:lactoylglutathione lyase
MTRDAKIGSGATLAPPRVLHCMMEVRDLGRSIAFYETALVFRVAERHRYPGHSLVYLRGDAGDFEIELIQPDTGPAGMPPQTRGWHVAFGVRDLRAEHTRLKAAGLSPGAIEAYCPDGKYLAEYFYLHDPDGHEIEYLEERGRYARPSPG